ncbi:MAG: class beta-lactamase-related serine hydrolase [Eubacterium sp.]|jgi:hypothetical protein|nr:class beta-lactamase-related serine hydrolase [Eubacterium sp.]
MTPERSTPARQGLNTDKLFSLVKYINESHIGINSFMVLKNGNIVTEAYFYPYHNAVEYQIDNCTSIVIATLVGIAIKEGYIGSEKDRVIDYFTDIPQEDFARKEVITIEHLLNMSSGMEWNDVSFNENNSLNKLWHSDNSSEFIISRPMVHEPGVKYNHNLGGIHLLSAILQKATGMAVPAYAFEKLFKPLGINAPEWAEDRQNVAMGFYGLCLKLEDMAKMGQLYLQKGSWNGVQIVPEAWITASTKKHMDTPEGPWSFYGCGYVWNMNRFGGYCVKSLKGYSIYVLPRYSIVIAMAGSLLIQELHLPETLIETYILPAAKHMVERNGVSRQEQLDRLLEEISAPPKSKPVRMLPKTALLISGITYGMEPTIEEEKFTFYFKDKDQCKMIVQLYGNTYEMWIGLDGVYRVTHTDAYKGYWENSKVFILEKKMLRGSGEIKYRFGFDSDKLTVNVWASFANGEIGASAGKREQ